ncbi:hypothetical protein P7D15_01390 [Bacillus cereus]|uniref:hypothetical protein n=1 Tax=Bacillus cereus TaxID=1396 RepID=UPI0024075FC4|nr:hypothetical protein [Bacillus cereus]MDF9599068.1 hypothetical protein [Bacillus cereus]MDG1589401.1 hypothetical protein [Bacillus cereus]
MFEDIYIVFLPEGERIELSFILKIEGDRFYEFYKKQYNNHNSDLSDYFPDYQETYEAYLKNFLLPYLQGYKEIFIGYDSWKDEGIWTAKNHKNQLRGILLPRLNYGFYKGVLAYRKWQNIK